MLLACTARATSATHQPPVRNDRDRPVYLVLTPTKCETHEQHTSAHLGARESLDIAQIERVQQQAPFVKAQGVEQQLEERHDSLVNSSRCESSPLFAGSDFPNMVLFREVGDETS